MAKVLVLRDITNGINFAVTGNCQIGRTLTNGVWEKKDRDMPSCFPTLEELITIPDQKKYLRISRNHAAILKREGGFYLTDLNSKAGTFVGGYDINYSRNNSESILLQNGDLLHLGVNVGGRSIFSDFHYKGDLLRLVSYEVKIKEANNFALLVASGEDNDNAAKFQTELLGELLWERGYVVKTLLNSEVSKHSIRREIRRIANLSDDNSSVFISLYGHGGDNGYRAGKQLVNSKELYKEVGKINGSKGLLLEFCKSGNFVEGKNALKIPSDTTILTASGRNKGAGETLFDRDDGSEAIYLGRLHGKVISYLRESECDFSINAFYDDISSDPRLARLKNQDPLFVGKEYVLLRSSPFFEKVFF